MPSLPEGMVLRAVWTVIDRDRLEDEGLTQNVTAFREDKIHDYLVQDGKIRFYSLVCETGVPVELAFEFETLEASLVRTPSRARRMGRGLLSSGPGGRLVARHPPQLCQLIPNSVSLLPSPICPEGVPFLD